MTTIVKRITKGTILTVAELDSNVANLNTAKLEVAGGTLTGLPVLANQDVDIISPVYPTTKPSLNLDFTRGQLDPRVTFARNSTAAYYDGKTTAKAEENLLTYSQDSTNAVWVTNVSSKFTTTINDPTGVSASIGTVTSSGTGRGIQQNYTAIAATYTFSVYLQRSSGTGDITISLDSGGTQSITGVGASWVRYSITTAVTAGALSVRILCATSGDSFYFWGAQLEQRSSVTAYTPTTTAAITNYIPVLKFAPANVPRFDYDPITGKPLGLLIEEGRANYLLNSNTPTTQPVGASPPTVTTESIVLPDGTIGMCSKVLFASSGDTRVRVPAYGTWSGNYYFSVFYKVSGDLGWKRYSGAASIAASLLYFDIGSSGLDGSSWYGKTVYFTFGQLEAGSFATSYIPTTTGSVGRFADEARMTGSNFSSWYNQSEGSMYVETTNASNGIIYGRISSINSANNSIELLTYPNSYLGGAVNLNGSFIFNSFVTASVLTVLTKSLISYSATSVSLIANGNTVLSAALTAPPTNLNKLNIGTNANNQFFLCGHIKKLTYYPKALPSTELQALTS